MRSPSIAVLVLVAAACTHPRATPAAASRATRATARQEAARLATGRHVVQTVCATCHSEQPPMKNAPPLSMVAMHYRQGTRDSAEAVARIASWVRVPGRGRSLLPPMAIEHFGIMPAFVLPDSLLEAAAVYVLSLPQPAMKQGMQGMHQTMHPGMAQHPPMPPTKRTP